MRFSIFAFHSEVKENRFGIEAANMHHIAAEHSDERTDFAAHYIEQTIENHTHAKPKSETKIKVDTN